MRYVGRNMTCTQASFLGADSREPLYVSCHHCYAHSRSLSRGPVAASSATAPLERMGLSASAMLPVSNQPVNELGLLSTEPVTTWDTWARGTLCIADVLDGGRCLAVPPLCVSDCPGTILLEVAGRFCGSSTAVTYLSVLLRARANEFTLHSESEIGKIGGCDQAVLKSKPPLSRSQSRRPDAARASRGARGARPDLWRHSVDDLASTPSGGDRGS